MEPAEAVEGWIRSSFHALRLGVRFCVRLNDLSRLSSFFCNSRKNIDRLAEGRFERPSKLRDD
jgi:hypothetical protein